jgi:predicted MFS family arabinose efflux permease
VLADRVRNRARLMAVAEGAAMAAQLGAALLFLTGRASVGALATLAVVNGTAVALFYPAMTGLVPQLAQGEALQSANALIRLSTNLAGILGTALGGVLVAAVGAGWALLVDSATYAVSAALLLLVRPGERVPDAVERATSMLADLLHGWREFTSRRWVWLLVVLFSLSNFGFTAAIGVLGPVQSLQSYDGARSWAAIMATFSLGTLVGVLVAMRLRPRRPLRTALLAELVVALPVLALSVPAPVPLVVALAFVSGVGVDVFEVLWQTALQQHVPGESLSRVSAYDWFGSLALTPVALALAGPLAAAVGLGPAIAICGGLGALSCLALLDPQVRGLRAGVEGAAPGPAAAHVADA